MSELTELESKAADAILKALETGSWLDNSSVTIKLFEHGMSGLLKREEQKAEPEQDGAKRVEVGDDIDAEGWTSDMVYAWRLVLPGTTAPCVLYFQSEPDYQTIKMFARAAGVPAATVMAEHRPDGE